VSSPVSSPKSANREDWLNQAVALMRPWFTEHALTVPATVHVSVGWPSKSALSAKRQRLGECWYGETSSDGCPQLFVSPTIADSLRMLDVLLHEMLHTALPKAKHGPKFAKHAQLLGLEGKPTATVAGKELLAKLKAVVEKLGPMPHAGLVVTRKHKPQSVRMLKLVAVECCGYVARTTRKWLDEEGALLCPHGVEMELES